MYMGSLLKCLDNATMTTQNKYIKCALKIISTTKQNRDKDKEKKNVSESEITLTNATNTAIHHHPANQKPTTPSILNRNIPR